MALKFEQQIINSIANRFTWLPKKAIMPLVAAVLVVGVTATAFAFSYGSIVSVEPESGTRSGGATAVADVSASGGQSLRFNGVNPDCAGIPMHEPGGSDGMGGCWPGPYNTGYPQGLFGDTRTPVTLTAYTGPSTIDTCGIVIDSKIVDAELLITAGNGTNSPDTPCVTIKNSLIKGVVHTDYADDGPVVIEDTEIDVSGSVGWWENIGRYNTFAWRVNSHGGEGVIKCANYCAAYDSWVHGMHLGGEYHYNAFGSNGIEVADGYFIIDHNYADCSGFATWDANPGSDAGCSANIGFYGDFAPLRNITVNRNFLAGASDNPAIPNNSSRQPGYCLNPGYYPGKPYPEPTNMKITNNIFGRGYTNKCGVYGPTNSMTTATNTWINNRYTDGEIIPQATE